MSTIEIEPDPLGVLLARLLFAYGIAVIFSPYPPFSITGKFVGAFFIMPLTLLGFPAFSIPNPVVGVILVIVSLGFEFLVIVPADKIDGGGPE